MKRLRILFDGVEVAETPDGWEDIESVIERQKDINSIFIRNEARLTFRHDGYDTLITKYNTGFCSSVTAELQELCDGVYNPFFTGIIFLSSSKIDRKECTIEVEVKDNSFYAKIDNNKSLEVFPFAEQTKSGLTIAACAYEKVQMFDPNDGTYIGVLVNPPFTGACYPVYNLFEYLISFMSDNTVDFDSTLFGVGGDYEGLTVTAGIVLRQYLMGGTTENDFKNNFQKISFNDLFSEVRKKINIGMFVEYSNGRPKIRIERKSFLQGSSVSFSALNIDGLIERVAQEEIYSSIRLGSNTVSDKQYTAPETGLLFPEDISGAGFKNEQFIVIVDCNIDQELDLVSNYIIAHNPIEDCLIHGETSYDDQLIFIMCDVSVYGNYSAQQGNLENQAGNLPVYYNLALNGLSVLNNYFGSIPFSIAQYLGNRDNTFSAINNSSYVLDDFSGAFTDELLPFPTDVFDPNALWDGNYYTVTASGLYSFDVNFIVGVQQAILSFELYIDRLDAGLVLQSSVLIHSEPFLQYIVKPIHASGSIVTNSGEFIRIRIHYLLSTAFNPTVSTIYAGATVACTNTVDGGGVYKTFDPNDYPVIKHEWEYPLTISDFNSMALNQTFQLEFARSGEKHYNGWIDQVKFKRFKEENAKFVTYTSKNMIR